MLIKLYGQIQKIVKNIMQDEITVYSAQASYYIAISSFPFIMLLLSLAGFFIPEYRNIILSGIQSVIPKTLQTAMITLTNELFEKSVPILSISALTALWSASRGIAAVERGIRRVYNVKKSRNFLLEYLISMVYTVVFIILLLLTLLLQVFGNTILAFAEEYITLSGTQIVLIRTLLFFVLMCAIFLAMYFMFSQRKIPLKMHLPGAFATSVSWILFSQLYSLYIDNFANYSYIYGSITAVVLMMLWLYFCVIIMLAGAEINKFFILKKGYRLYE